MTNFKISEKNLVSSSEILKFAQKSKVRNLIYPKNFGFEKRYAKMNVTTEFLVLDLVENEYKFNFFQKF